MNGSDEKCPGIAEGIDGKDNLHAVINNTSDLIWSVDRNYKLISSNTAF